MSDKILLPASIIIAGLLIGGGFYLKSRSIQENPDSGVNPAREEITSDNLAKAMRPIDANDHVLGSLNSRIIVVEYSDTECPFCKNFHSNMVRLMQEYGKDQKMAWVYRHFPIAEIHSKAPKESEALECAGELGGNSKFWEYTNRIYEITPSNDQLDPLELTKVATEIGLSSSSFNTCLQSGEFRARVNLDIQNANELGALGTPYSILIDTKNNDYYPIEGAYPYDQMKNIIELILES